MAFQIILKCFVFVVFPFLSSYFFFFFGCHDNKTISKMSHVDFINNANLNMILCGCFFLFNRLFSWNMQTLILPLTVNGLYHECLCVRCGNFCDTVHVQALSINTIIRNDFSLNIFIRLRCSATTSDIWFNDKIMPKYMK